MLIKHRGALLKPFIKKEKDLQPPQPPQPQRKLGIYSKAAIAMGLPTLSSSSLSPADANKARPRNAKLPLGETTELMSPTTTELSVPPQEAQAAQRPSSKRMYSPVAGIAESSHAQSDYLIDLQPADRSNKEVGQSLVHFLQMVDDDSLDKRFGKGNAELVRSMGWRDLADTHQNVLLARANGEVVGFADFQESRTYAEGTVADVGVIVAKEHQRRRLGEQLLRGVEKTVIEAGYKFCLATVFDDNDPQLARMKKLGAKEVTSADDKRQRIFLVPLKAEYRDLEPEAREVSGDEASVSSIALSDFMGSMSSSQAEGEDDNLHHIW